MKEQLIKLKIHSIVSEITNSSTVIYTYQDGSIEPAKELVNEVLKLSDITDKTADDIFYFGVFCEDNIYLERLLDLDDIPEDYPKTVGSYGSSEYNECQTQQKKWLDDIVKSILTGEIEKPQWMKDIEESDYEWSPDSYLTLIPKDEKYSDFGDKIKALLNSINTDGGRDG